MCQDGSAGGARLRGGRRLCVRVDSRLRRVRGGASVLRRARRRVCGRLRAGGRNRERNVGVDDVHLSVRLVGVHQRLDEVAITVATRLAG